LGCAIGSALTEGGHETWLVDRFAAHVEAMRRDGLQVDDANGSRHVLDDQQSAYFLQLNMGKRGVSVDMKDPRGKEFMRRLCDSADVFIENYRPGALDKLGPSGMPRCPGAIRASCTAPSRHTAIPDRTRIARASA
jgi:crotonobetainyl-CoA:carnitine CoA-transferase CaiB-like acyl-CoA transferase